MKHILAVTLMFALSLFGMGCGDGSAPESNEPAPTPELGEASSDPSLMDDAATVDADSSVPQPSDENASADEAANKSAGDESIPSTPPEANSEPPAQTSKGNSKPAETEVIEDDQDEEE